MEAGFDLRSDARVIGALCEIDPDVRFSVSRRIDSLLAKSIQGQWIAERFGDTDDQTDSTSKLAPSNYDSAAYAKHAWTYAAIRAIVGTGSRCPWGIRRRKDQKRLPGHPAEEIIRYANPVQNGQRLLGTTLLSNELWGYSYWHMELAKKRLAALWPVPPRRMKRSKTVHGVPAEYEYTDDERRPVRFPADEVVWFHYEGPGHWLATQSPMDAAAQAVQTDLYSIRMQERFFEHGHHSFALTTDQQLTPDKVKELRTQWSENYRGLSHFFKPPVLHSGLKPGDIGKGFGPESLELRSQLRQDVLAVFHVPPAIVGLYESAQFGVSIEKQRRLFWEDCLQPRLDGIAADLTDQLVIRIDDAAEFYWMYDLVPALQPDWSVMIGPLVQAVGGPFMMQDEAREIVGKEPIPGGRGRVWFESMAMLPSGPGAEGGGGSAPSSPEPEKPTVNEDEGSPEEPTVAEDEDQPEKHVGPWIITKGRNGKTLRRLSREARVARWRSLNAERKRQQKVLAEQLGPAYDALAEQVIGNLRAAKLGSAQRVKDPALDRLVFGQNDGKAAFVDVIEPFLQQLAVATGQQAADQIGAGITFSLDTTRMEAALKARALRMNSIASTAQEACRASLAEGLAAGEAVDKLEERVLQWALAGKERHAETIARTEVGCVMNAAAVEGWQQGGATSKEWLCIVDDRTRGAKEKDKTDHLSHDGEVIPMGDQFVLAGSAGQELADYPMADGLSAEQTCNCRCFVDSQVPIFTKDGWRAISKLNVGDLVLTHKGRFRAVTALLREPMYAGDVVKLRFRMSDRSDSSKRAITVTPEHPVLTRRGWLAAQDVVTGDQLVALGLPCLNCGKPAPLWYGSGYCSEACGRSHSHKVQWQDEDHRELISRKTSEQLHREYAAGVRDPQTIAVAAREAAFEKYGPGGYIGANREGLQPAITASICEKYGSHLEFLKQYAFPALGRSNNGSRLNAAMAKFLAKIGWEAIPEFCVGRRRADFYVPSEKLFVECDGAFFHQDAERDRLRDIEILRQYPDHSIAHVRYGVGDKGRPVWEYRSLETLNDEHQYGQFESEVLEVSRWKLRKPRTRWNLTVEEDESFVAKGIVVHNCTSAPVFEEEAGAEAA